MFKKFIKITLRNLAKNKGYTFINISGLAMGMAVVILISLWVYDDFNYNKYHKKHSRIGQIYHNEKDTKTGEIQTDASIFYLFNNVLKEKHSDYFEHILKADWFKDHTLTANDKISTKAGMFIEDGALDMFSLEMIKGSYSSLKELNAIVLSESTAKSIFGQENPIGKSIKINNEMNATVSGVFKDLPTNTRFRHLHFLANWNLFESHDPLFSWVKDVWDGWYFNTYVELKPGISFEMVNNDLKKFYEKYPPKELIKNYKKNATHPFVYPMDKWHLYSDFEQGVPTKGRIIYIRLFIVIAFFVLFLACINFMNLSTARSEKRSKEVGILKTVGSNKKQLIFQFLSESVLIATLSAILALIIVALSLDWFNTLSGKKMQLLWEVPLFWILLASFILLTGILAGSYPAFYLSAFNPVKVLKGISKTKNSSVVFRKALVVFQFGISIMLAVGAFVIYQQIQYTKNRALGYNQNNLIYLDMNSPEYYGKYNILREELKKTGVVEEMAQSRSPQTAIYLNGGGFNWPGKDPEFEDNFALLGITHDYGKTVGWELIEGRDYSREITSDSLALVINEAAAEYMNLENPVGAYITYGDSQPLKIIGKVKNMIAESPYEPVRQAIYFINYKGAEFMHLKLKDGVATSVALDQVKSVFNKIVPTANFDYRFVDQDYDLKFRSEQRLGKLAGVFTLLAIFISCLGLIGLASYVAEQRTKEIGIRKVLGDSVQNIWIKLSQDFLILVIISCIIAIPLINYFMSEWLLNYNYRMKIPIWISIITAFTALIITLLTVSFHAIRVARKNPVEALKVE